MYFSAAPRKAGSNFPCRKFPLDGRVGWAGCGTALHAALTYEGELGGVIGYLAKMRLICDKT